ncbi:hypothetical protein NPX13_g11466 [Xylaria arbuscula]|uniref:DUF4939 domain-containing protein n=1 Tax=Xylaria arbuscula TaxID=114810 RepID=A0A9W8TFQ5_9PEZI|nr:hypothetical protein NPX13_g11466 [Xylaria arbuscula]
MATPMPEVKGYKPIVPKPYDGSTDVDAFLVQARVYLRFHESSITTDSQKVMVVSHLLSGKVIQWSQPMLQDFLEANQPTELTKEISNVFQDYATVYLKDK